MKSMETMDERGKILSLRRDEVGRTDADRMNDADELFACSILRGTASWTGFG